MNIKLDYYCNKTSEYNGSLKEDELEILISNYQLNDFKKMINNLRRKKPKIDKN